MKYTFSSRLVLYTIFLLSFSCSSDLDFNQTKNLKLEPAYVANLVYFDIPAPEFVTAGAENQFSDHYTVDIFNNNFLVNNLNKVDFDFEINNTINRSYSLEVKLLDANGGQLDMIQFSIPTYSGVENIITQKKIFQGTSLSIFKNTAKIEMVLKMLPGSTLTEFSSGSIKLSSGLTAYFVI